MENAKIKKVKCDILGDFQTLCIGVIILVAILTAIVQRAVFLTFDRLGQRHINEIIVPVLVSNTMFEYHPKCLTIVILNCSQF